MIKEWIRRVRAVRFWGLHVIAWWLILKGVGYGIFAALSLGGGTSLDGIVGLLLQIAFHLVAGLSLRDRHPMGWWFAMFIFGWALSQAGATFAYVNLQVFVFHAIPGNPFERVWDSFLFSVGPSLLWDGLPILYLTRPKVRAQF